MSVSDVDSLATGETTSSSDTSWGPGTLSGRAIKSLGEASLRGVESLMIKWRLAKISSNLPKNSSFDKMEKIYDDLIELSRLEYYDAKVRTKALRMIMMQIGSRETAQLVACLAKWPGSEITIFLSEMISCMHLFWNQNSPVVTKSQSELLSVYTSSQSTAESHEILPFLAFIDQLASVDNTTCRAVLDANTLDIIVEVCEECNFETYPEVVAATKAVISVFLDNPKALDYLRPYRLDLVWPRRSDQMPLCSQSLLLAEFTSRTRRQRLLNMSSNLIWNRLCEIEVIMNTSDYYNDNSSEKDLFDICFDLLHLSTGQNDFDISRSSYGYLLQCLALDDCWRDALKEVLATASYEENLDFFYRLIHPLLCLKSEVLPVAAKFYTNITERHPDANPILYFIKFAIQVAETSDQSALALKDADIIPLLGSIRQTSNEVTSLILRFQAVWNVTGAHTQRIGNRNRSGSNSTIR